MKPNVLVGLSRTRKKLAIIIVILIIGAIFQPAINGFVSERIFYLQKPDIIVKKDSEKITLSHGDPGYDEISHQALDMIFSYNDFISQTRSTFLLVVPVDTDMDTVAGDLSYVRITVNPPFGKRIYVVMIDPFDTHGGQIYHSNTGNGWRAYAAKDPQDFKTLEDIINNLPDIGLIEAIIIHQNGESITIAQGDEGFDRIGGLALNTLGRINAQIQYAVSPEETEDIKAKDKVIEVVFLEPTAITTSHWVAPEYRGDVLINKEGYRVLENKDRVMLIVEDNRGKGMEGKILIKPEGSDMWGCWTIEKKDFWIHREDKGWVEEIEKVLGGGG
jgi:hypothetical protein